MSKEIKDKQETHERPLVVLRGVYDEVLEDTNYVLFGENQCIRENEKMYDLAFHAVKTPIKSLEHTTSLVIPVLEAKKDDKETKKNIYEINQIHPWIDLIAVKYDELCFKNSRKGRKISGNLLKFYEVNNSRLKNVDLGKEIVDIGENWKIVNEKELLQISDHPEEFYSFLKQKRELINKTYFT